MADDLSRNFIPDLFGTGRPPDPSKPATQKRKLTKRRSRLCYAITGENQITIFGAASGDIHLDVPLKENSSGSIMTRVGVDFNDPRTFSNEEVQIKYGGGKIEQVKYDNKILKSKDELERLEAEAKQFRTFVDITGKQKMSAKFEKLQGEYVMLRNRKGKSGRIRFDRLSQKDQKWVRREVSETTSEHTAD